MRQDAPYFTSLGQSSGRCQSVNERRETLYSPRFRVSRFPTSAQLELIGGEPLGADEA